ncbi:MAG TPA: PEP-CTERM sorting domain-containing protein [Bryobacteraceae bacterium]|nr:PEP-CTERM sorting domain-containing protein [Bryobacteraceae bacterium]
MIPGLQKKHAQTGLLAVVLLAGAAVAPARADQITFDFNSLASGAPASGGVGTNASIQNYMNNLLATHGCPGCSVKVTGAVADRTYSGEGHVVGPLSNGHYKSLTLGTSDGATDNSGTLNAGYDTFIANTNDSSHQISNQITLKFSGFAINGPVSFDFEIFPDGSAQQPPDFEFEAGNNSNGSDPHVLGFGVNGIQYGVAPSTHGNGTRTHSPNSGSGVEASKQWIGHWSGSLNNVTELDFIDWPPTVAIDNLTVSRVPEPGGFLLLGTALGALGFLRKRKKSRVQQSPK